MNSKRGKENNFYKHGMNKTKFHRIWCCFRRRCNNKNVWDYKYYGAKGITYDKRWDNFLNVYCHITTPVVILIKCSQPWIHLTAAFWSDPFSSLRMNSANL